MIFGREPVLVTAFISAVILLFINVGFNVPEGFDVALNGVILAGAALFARSQVSPVGHLHEDEDIPFIG